MIQFVIEPGQDSNALEIADYLYLSLLFPDVWDGGTSVTILGSNRKDGTYQELHTEDGTKVTVAAAANRLVAITAEFAEAVSSQTYIKLRPLQAVAEARTVEVVAR
jgi:hypothetical protein